jgi:hypothetical protein
MKRYFVEIMVGALSGAAAFVATAETYPASWCSGDKDPVLTGAFLGLPLGNLIGIAIVDKFVYKIERQSMAARIYRTTLCFLLSWVVLIGTLIMMDYVSGLAAYSAPITVSCACVFYRHHVRFRNPTAENVVLGSVCILFYALSAMNIVGALMDYPEGWLKFVVFGALGFSVVVAWRKEFWIRAVALILWATIGVAAIAQKLLAS